MIKDKKARFPTVGKRSFKLGKEETEERKLCGGILELEILV